MSPCDTEYFRNRAASERANAAVASSVVAEIHLELARRYEQLLGDEKPCSRTDRSALQANAPSAITEGV
jgi:hypothetical protein